MTNVERKDDIVSEELYTREYLESGRGAVEYSPHIERANINPEVEVELYDESQDDKLKRRGLMVAFGMLAAALPTVIFLIIWNVAS